MKVVEEQLGFQFIIEQLVTYYQFTLSHDYTSKYVRFENTYDTAVQQYQYTEQMYDIINIVGSPVNLHHLDSFLLLDKKMTKHIILDPQELLQIVYLFQNIARIKKYYGSHERVLQEYNLIVSLLETMPEQQQLLTAITSIVDMQGEILDTASKALSDIRLQIRTTEKDIRETLKNSLIKYQSQLAEQYFTIRNNRYVLPIKTEYRNSFKGILHDQSASGTTAYIEPEYIVQLNNKLQQLRIMEKHEIEQILQQVSEKIFPLAVEISGATDLLAKYDIIQAKALYAIAQGHYKFRFVQEHKITLYDAVHPLLDNKVAIKNNILLGIPYSTLMITGANTGGKSVFLKTTGLLVLMAQSGFLLPVNQDGDNQIAVFSQVFIDIGDEQSLEQNLSTFSSHMTNIKHILDEVDERSLVLLDELGSGTDPMQGSALAIAILKMLQQKHTLVIGTTHYNEVKEYIAQEPTAENAAMQFDLERMMPLYNIRYGSYGASYAFDIASILGLPTELITIAKQQLQSETKTQELLAIYEQRLESLDEQQLLQKQLQLQLENDRTQFEQEVAGKRKAWEKQEQALIVAAEKKMAKKITQINQLLTELKQKTTVKQNEYADLKGQFNQLQNDVPTQELNPKKAQNIQFAVGDIVYVDNLKSNGTLLKLQNNKWLVKVGVMSTLIGVDELTLVKKAGVQQQTKTSGKIKKTMKAVSSKIDLRGVRVHEGIQALNTYLDNAASQHEVISIIHGHGTGSMRNAVQDALKRHPKVKSYRFGGAGEGGVGATIVEFKD